MEDFNRELQSAAEGYIAGTKKSVGGGAKNRYCNLACKLKYAEALLTRSCHHWQKKRGGLCPPSQKGVGQLLPLPSLSYIYIPLCLYTRYID